MGKNRTEKRGTQRRNGVLLKRGGVRENEEGKQETGTEERQDSISVAEAEDR